MEEWTKLPVINELAHEYEIISCLEMCTDNSIKRDLLGFLKKHPRAKFTSSIIAGLLSCRRVYVEEALECFVQAELMEKHIVHGMHYYCLTAEPGRQETIMKFQPISGLAPSR